MKQEAQKKEKENADNATTPEFENANVVPIIYAENNTLLSRYVQYPYWLERCGLPPTARILYMTIHHRAITCSIHNHQQYSNNQDHLFVIYTNESLAKDCDIKLSALKSAKKLLKAKGFIKVEPIKHSSAVRIYPCFPADAQTYRSNQGVHQKSPHCSNSSFATKDFADAALKKHLPPEVYNGYQNLKHSTD